MRSKHIEEQHGRGHAKHSLQRYKEGFAEDAEKILKYSIYYKLAKGRNSFSKTDPDATFMHMKYDYYNHTNVFKPGYNVQMGSSNGYIRHIYVSGDARPEYIHSFYGRISQSLWMLSQKDAGRCRIWQL